MISYLERAESGIELTLAPQLQRACCGDALGDYCGSLCVLRRLGHQMLYGQRGEFDVNVDAIDERT